MVGIIKVLMKAVNDIHDVIIKQAHSAGYNFSDKQLHFILIGIVGMLIFVATQSVFRWLAKYSITAISFIYTFTVLMVIVFGIEIGQKITKRGNMEFADIVAGVNGFLYIFIVYLIIRIITYLMKKILSYSNNKKHKNL
ncbi:hypothetical protein CPJCM30710_08600 [Clostridium polyendosporum]|uniref:Uncharacterized protein n=1 Tax=Clostridium polyendosporum TaxID=69208 RepID=A0A919RXQ0_9CLOT|nr:hypothetical protein [Clostridium polyendosporum]GIM28194.1 hypothetical protein CPJCM30710_08600 [Clostridium polyendosporum]